MGQCSDAYRSQVIGAQGVRQEFFKLQLPRILRVRVLLSLLRVKLTVFATVQSLKECTDELDLGTQYHLARYAYLFENTLVNDGLTISPVSIEDGSSFPLPRLHALLTAPQVPASKPSSKPSTSATTSRPSCSSTLLPGRCPANADLVATVRPKTASWVLPPPSFPPPSLTPHRSLLVPSSPLARPLYHSTKAPLRARRSASTSASRCIVMDSRCRACWRSAVRRSSCTGSS